MDRRFPLVTLGLILLSGEVMSAESMEKFRLIEVPELESLQKDSKRPVTVLDANEPEFRQQNGVIPGARLLSSFDKFDVSKELPADRDAPLVFYCADRL
jgi:hypothetical protein